MPSGMAEHIDLTEEANWIPEDTFGARLAVIRAKKRWNVLRAATECGLDSSSWTNWERDINKPQDYEMVCKKVARAFGCDLNWLANGGPMPARSRWGALTPLRVIPGRSHDTAQMNQLALPLFVRAADN